MAKNIEVFEHLTGEAKSIFSILQKNGPRAKSELALLTNIKLTTLNRIMQSLEETGLVRQSQIGESTGGRKPALYDVFANKHYIIGIDLSRTYTQIILTNLKLEMLDKQQFSMDVSCSPENTVRRISNLIESALIRLNVDTEKLLGIGLGTVGPLDREKGVMINPVNFEASGWNDIPIKKMLEDRWEKPVIVDNGANAAVLAETLFGKGRNYKNVVYFNCGIGIRTGVVSSGTIIRTINDTEDAFGHMVIDVYGEACNCGNYGCIECYSSIFSITKKYLSELRKRSAAVISKPLEEIDYRDICFAAEKGDELAREVITEAASILGTGLANFINLLNPELVILSGPLIKHSTIFYEVCTQVASQKCYVKKDHSNTFCRGGHFEEHAIAIGAAALVVESLLLSKILG